MWLKLNETWTKKVMSSKFRILDHTEKNENTLEYILYNVYAKIFRSTKIKKIVINYIKIIDDTTFSKLVENYTLEFDLKNILWNPATIMETKKKFIRAIKQPTFTFQKDDTTLFLIANAFDFDMIILDDTSNNIIDISDKNILRGNIVIFYKTQADIFLIGLKNDDKRKKNSTLFYRQNLPEPILNIINIDELFMKHINIILDSKKSKTVTLNSILSDIKLLNLTQVDTKTLIPMINEMLKNKEFFQKQNISN
jgi:hypothetical protein